MFFLKAGLFLTGLSIGKSYGLHVGEAGTGDHNELLLPLLGI